MGIYNFKFHECDGTVTEVRERVEAATLADARQLAIDHARAIMASEIAQGRLCLSCWIVIRDDRGANVLTLQFGDAIDFTGPNACNHETEAEALRRS